MSFSREDVWDVVVRFSTDPQYCQSHARTFALEAGFGPREATALAIVASELASNIVRHAGEGMLRLRRLEPAGVEVLAADRGPGIPDVSLALKDGYSRGRFNAEVLLEGKTADSLGCGLGAVQRLSDEMEIQSTPGQGTSVRARKWVQRAGREKS